MTIKRPLAEVYGVCQGSSCAL